MFLSLVRKELRHLERIAPRARALLLTFTLFAACWPLVWTFGGAYLWRRAPDPSVVVLFNIGLYGGLPVGFFSAGRAMRFVKVSILYGVGFFGIGASMLGFVLLGRTDPVSAVLGGAALGACAGVYWVNRILLTLHLTHDAERDFFFSVDAMFNTVMSVLMPASLGIIIQARLFLPSYLDEERSYTVLLSLALVTFATGAKVISRITFSVKPPAALRCTDRRQTWRAARTMMFVRGVADAASSALSVLLPLVVFHGERDLGGMQSLGALVTAIALYMIGRNIAQPGVRLHLMKVAVVFILTAALCVSASVNAFTVILFSLFNGLGTALIWTGLNAISLGAIQTMESRSEYWLSYVCDREACLAAGRVLGGIGVVIFFYLWGTSSIRFVALPFALTQIAMIPIAARASGPAADGTVTPR
jgi:YQGE family putative transporter